MEEQGKNYHYIIYYIKARLSDFPREIKSF